MHRAAMFLMFAAFAGLLYAQATDSFEIRGTVLEVAHAETITVQRGRAQTVSLKLTDLSR